VHGWPRQRLDAAAWLAAVAFLTLLWSGFADGGYFPPAWGWAALVLGWAAVMALIVRRSVRASRASLLFLAALCALLLWSLASLLWSSDTTTGVQDVQRDLVYVMAALFAVASTGPKARSRLTAAVASSLTITALYALLTWLLPDHLGLASDAHEPGRLYVPIGYWNGDGIDAAMALVLLGGYLTAGGSRVRAAACAAALPAVSAALFLTLSRGAIAAAAVGLAVCVIVAATPIRSGAALATLLPFSAAAVWLAERAGSLTGSGYTAASAPSAHRLALEIVGIAAAAGGWGWYLARAVERWRLPQIRPGRRLIASAVVAVLLVGGGLVATGVAGSGLQGAHRAFAGGGPGREAGTGRILSASSNGRDPMWKSAWHDLRRHPIAGAGIGSFGQRWLATRTDGMTASRWAHSLYLETLAETGIVGMILLAAVMATALWGGIRSRRTPMAPAVLGALAAYLVHAASDWDWQLTSITVAAVWLGSVLVTGDGEASISLRPRPRLAAAIALGLAGTCAAVFGLAGATELAAADAAARAGHAGPAVDHARSAASLEPWSGLPWMVIGQVRLADGRTTAAVRAYERAVARAPDRWEAWLDLAAASSGARRTHALRRAESLNPGAWQIRAFCRANAETLTLSGAPASYNGCRR
jgi:O-Antigen ligase